MNQKSRQHVEFSSISLVLCALLPLLVLLSACTEPSEYCTVYPNKSDQFECTDYCKKNRDFGGKDELIRACQAGQMIYLNHPTGRAEDAVLDCDDNLKHQTKEVQAACRAGVSAEQARSSKYLKDPGTSGGDGERETGNNRRHRF